MGWDDANVSTGTRPRRRAPGRVRWAVVPALTAALAATACAPGSPDDAATEQAAGAAPLVVGATWVAERIDDPSLVVLQVGPAETYDAEHLPGARHVTLEMVERPRSGDDDLVLQLPDAEELRRTLEGLGISDDARIVVAPSDGRVTAATRVLFTLDEAGLGDRAHFLDGGLEAWKAAGHPVTDDVPAVTPGTLTRPARSRVVDADWVREKATAPGIALVDARATAFYDGAREAMGARGHIPGALSLPVASLLSSEGGPGEGGAGEGGSSDVGEAGEEGASAEDPPTRLLPREELQRLFREAGVEEGDTVVAYCHIGQNASGVVLAARALGYETRLYDGSMNEWARLGLPVEGPPEG